jgi:hypothetical protein
MADRLPALIFGLGLLLVGVTMLSFQRRHGQAPAGPATDVQSRFLRRRARRRTQMAGMIVLIGVMIPLGDSVIPWHDAPATFAVYWLIVIGLALWTALLGMGDLISTRTQMLSELSRLKQQENQLRDAARRLQQLNQSRKPDQ